MFRPKVDAPWQVGLTNPTLSIARIGFLVSLKLHLRPG